MIIEISSFFGTRGISTNRTFNMVTIHHPLVDSITCLRKKPWYLYRNVTPVIPVYIIAISGFWKLETLGAWIVLGSVVFFHLLSFFMCIWSLRFRIYVRYQKVYDICLEIIGIGVIC